MVAIRKSYVELSGMTILSKVATSWHVSVLVSFDLVHQRPGVFVEEYFIVLSAHLPDHGSSAADFEAACSLVTEATMKQALRSALCWSGIRIVAGWDANLELKHLVGNLQEEEYGFLNTLPWAWRYRHRVP